MPIIYLCITFCDQGSFTIIIEAYHDLTGQGPRRGELESTLSNYLKNRVDAIVICIVTVQQPCDSVPNAFAHNNWNITLQCFYIFIRPTSRRSIVTAIDEFADCLDRFISLWMWNCHSPIVWTVANAQNQQWEHGSRTGRVISLWSNSTSRTYCIACSQL